MVPTDRYIMHPMERQEFLQPECPVYIHCSRRCTDRHSGMNFVRVRMVNCSDRMVCSVFLRIEGIGKAGQSCYVRNEVVLPDCNAMPRAVFGEDWLISLSAKEVERLLITVERVVFSDGMMWRRLPKQELLSVDAWNKCVCGMRNPQNSLNCILCGRRFVPRAAEDVYQTLPTPTVLPEPVPSVEFERPAPIVRTKLPPIEPITLPKKEKSSTGLLWTLLFLSFLAVTMVLGLYLYARQQNLLP